MRVSQPAVAGLDFFLNCTQKRNCNLTAEFVVASTSNSDEAKLLVLLCMDDATGIPSGSAFCFFFVHKQKCFSSPVVQLLNPNCKLVVFMSSFNENSQPFPVSKKLQVYTINHRFPGIVSHYVQAITWHSAQLPADTSIPHLHLSTSLSCSKPRLEAIQCTVPCLCPLLLSKQSLVVTL